MTIDKLTFRHYLYNWINYKATDPVRVNTYCFVTFYCSDWTDNYIRIVSYFQYHSACWTLLCPHRESVSAEECPYFLTQPHFDMQGIEDVIFLAVRFCMLRVSYYSPIVLSVYPTWSNRCSPSCIRISSLKSFYAAQKWNSPLMMIAYCLQVLTAEVSSRPVL